MTHQIDNGRRDHEDEVDIVLGAISFMEAHDSSVRDVPASAKSDAYRIRSEQLKSHDAERAGRFFVAFAAGVFCGAVVTLVATFSNIALPT